MKTKIVGLGHQSRVGKDTLAQMLVDEANDRGIRAVKIAFADVLKQKAHDLFHYAGVKHPLIYETQPHLREEILDLPGDPNVVDLWIDYGNKMRQIDPMVWVNSTMCRISNINQLTVISDVRFTNELEAISARDGMTVKVLRSGQTVRKSDLMVPSDWEWDHVIYNNTSLEDLKRKAVYLIDSWFGARNEVSVPSDAV